MHLGAGEARPQALAAVAGNANGGYDPGKSRTIDRAGKGPATRALRFWFTMARDSMRRGDYGFDAPYALVIFGLLAVATAFGAAMAWWRQLPIRAAASLTFYCVFFSANAFSFCYTTRRGKFIEWERILDRLHLRGDESTLDMGCGRGAVLTAVGPQVADGSRHWRGYLEHQRSVRESKGSHAPQRLP